MRKTRQDWLLAGLATLGSGGVDGLKIDRMADTLGVTKGSFYHHFEGARDFEEQLVAYWAGPYLSTAAGVPDDPGACLALLDLLMEEAYSPMTEPEIAIRNWAHRDERVRSTVEQVDAARSGFLVGLFWVLSGDERQARLMADLLFTMSIGSMTALPRIAPDRVLALYAEFKRLYGLGNTAVDAP